MKPDQSHDLAAELRDANHPPFAARPLGAFPHHPGQGRKRPVPPWEPGAGLAARLEKLRENGEQEE